VLPSPCYVVSDLHLGAAPREVERAFVAFLRSIRGRAAALVINGDLFDFWFEWRTVIPKTGFRVLAALADLAESGVGIVWIAGNHDCWGGDVLRQDVGVTYHVGPWEGSLAGWRARLEHGDGLRAVEDRKYRMLRGVIRHPWSVRAFRLLHPDLGSRLANGSSHASRTYRAPDDGLGLRAVAMDMLAAHPALELLVFGHSHVASLARAANGGVYANPGSWLDAPAFLRVTPHLVELRRWDGSAEGDRIDALDRLPEKALAQS
jgi:UDP-2,3-diacylglucosamine hydrolase